MTTADERPLNPQFTNSHADSSLPMPATKSTRSFTPYPVAPPLAPSHTGPAMSICAHGAFVNSWRKSAAVIAPPPLGPTLVRSAIFDLVSSLYSADARGMRHTFSPVALLDFSSAAATPSSELQTPAYLSPSEMMQAPVSVAMSTTASILGPGKLSANTRASASVSRPSASVLITSMVFPLDAVRTSPGRMARSLIMFSHAATMKCTSTPRGCSKPTALAAPNTAALPPMSNFIISIIEPAPAFKL
mmetsp:Transcript_32802/g.67001  ORF Transcript_32802/g.67001 Transcript_32802/m.67001 type:complete len:246 (-) Transcript_32802:288-1025(-)